MNELPSYEEAVAIMDLHHRVAGANHAELARIAEEFLRGTDDDADLATKQLLADAIFAESTLR